MTVLDTLRGRRTTGAASAGSGRPEASAPFAGYDRSDSSELVRTLADHSQVELEAADAYERTHKNRLAVLDKLHYLRGPEPLPDYDSLDADQILAAVSAADDKTLKKARSYERKFGRRPKVLDAIAQLQRERRAAQPASEPPSYQPQSAPDEG